MGNNIESENWLFEKIDEIDKPLANLPEKKTRVDKITNVKKEIITTDSKYNETIIKEYYEHVHAAKLKTYLSLKDTNCQNSHKEKNII